MIEVTIDDLVTIVKTNCKDSITSENIKEVLMDRFSLIETDVIDQDIIRELTKLLLHLSDQGQKDSDKREVHDETVTVIRIKGNRKRIIKMDEEDDKHMTNMTKRKLAKRICYQCRKPGHFVNQCTDN